MATVEQLAIVMISLLLVILVFWMLITKNANKSVFGKIFALGAMGWTVAFLVRLIPLSIMQVVALLYLGADFNNPQSVTILATHPLVTIWGPIFAALFEEGTRYFITSKHNPIALDERLGPLSLGLGWSTAEILVIYGSTVIGLALNPQFQEFADWGLVLAGGVERISATILHVALSFLVVQARKEQFPQVISLWFAMSFHFIINALIIVWQKLLAPIIGNNLLLWTWSLELAIAAVALLTLVFTVDFWIPRKRESVSSS